MSERTLQVHIALLVTLGTMLLSVSERSSVYPILIVFAAFTSIFVTDILKWFQLNRTFANLAAVFALVFVADFFQRAPNGQLMAIANMLMYLQIILFFQTKSPRVYGHLAVLSLLQVVVSAAFSIGFFSGVLLVAYSAVGFSTLIMLFKFRENAIYQFAEPTMSEAAVLARQPNAKEDDWRHLLGRPAVVHGAPPAKTLPQVLSGWRHFRLTGYLLFMTGLFTTVMFYSIPRDRSFRSPSSRGAGRGQVGFTKEISLDEMGEILQRHVPVMRVTFADDDGQFSVHGPVYFHGVDLLNYDNSKRNGAWKRSDFKLRAPVPTPPDFANLVLQQVILESPKSRECFTAMPAYSVDQTTRHLLQNPETRLLFPSITGPTFDRYILGVDSFRAGMHRSTTASTINLDPSGIHYDDNYRQLALAPFNLPAEDVSEDQQSILAMKKFADKVLDEEDAHDASKFQKMRHLQNHFLYSEDYTYTLDFSKVDRNPESGDPIVDFMENHKSGHCEYYASALTMMLRSQGIPARLVIGYRVENYNDVGNYFQVNQSDAHAWVEAYLAPGEVPSYELDNVLSDQNGAWVRLDPTPAATTTMSDFLANDMFSRINEGLDFVELLWDEYVLGFNYERQRETVYEPFADGRDKAVSSVIDAKWLQGYMDRMNSWLAPDPQENRGRWLLRMLRNAVLVIAFLYVAGRISWRFQHWFKTRKNSPGNNSRRNGPVVPFYQQLESTFATLQQFRQPGQTQREFATAMAGTLTLPTAQPTATADPLSTSEIRIDEHLHAVVDAFYRVRFGKGTVPESEMESIQSSLQIVEAAVNEKLSETNE